MNRRTLLRGMAGAVITGVAGPPPPPRPAGAFSFLLLGDTHYDRPDYHDMRWLGRAYPNDAWQVGAYSQFTRQTLPQLLASARAVAGFSRPPAKWAIQLGDLVEGFCGNPDLARRQAEDALAFFHTSLPGMPFLVTKGNHDISGPGAPIAYREVIRADIARQIGQDLKSASFTVREGDSLLIFLDAWDPNAIGWLEGQLAEPARHHFVITHVPAVPCGPRSLWYLYPGAPMQAQRKRLLSALGRSHAIVLCGHLHAYGAIVRRTDEGSFVQLAICSVLPALDAKPAHFMVGPQCYSPDLVRLDPKFEPATEMRRRQMLQSEAPFIAHYEYAYAPGFAMVNVEDDRVRARIYVGLERHPWRRLDLSGLLACGR